MKFLKNSLKSNAGFTLLEVLIAMAILTVSLASILAVESGSIHATERAKQMNIVGMLAKNTMIEAEFKVQGKKFEEITPEESGKFENPYQDFSWKTTVKELKFPNITNLGGGANTEGGSQTQSGKSPNQSTEMIGRVITNYLSKAIREITVTIYWGVPRAGTGKRQEFSVSTYWVDLNHAVSLSE